MVPFTTLLPSAALIGALLAATAQDFPERASGDYAKRLAAYGPIRVCIGDVALRVDEHEAAAGFARSDGSLHVVTLLQQPWRALTLRIGSADLSAYKYTTDMVRLASGLTATRYRLPKWEGYRAGIPGEAVYSSEPAHRVYHVGSGANGAWVTADTFKGKDEDRTLLDRLEPRGSDKCDALLPPGVEGTVPTAEAYRPEKTIGPARVCGNGLAFDLRAGETLMRRWQGGWWVKGPDATFDIGLYFERNPALKPQSLAAYRVELSYYDPNYLGIAWPADARISSRSSSRSMGGIRYFNTTRETAEALLKRISIPDPNDKQCFEP